MAISVALAYQSVTVAGTAIGFDATPATNGIAPAAALITVETAQIRVRADGGDPTASEGHIVEPGEEIELTSRSDCLRFRAIRTGSVSAVIKVTKANNTVAT